MIALLVFLFLSISSRTTPLHYHRVPVILSNATKCDESLFINIKNGLPEHLREFSKSQSGEDLHLLSFLDNLCNGTFIELGALDGVQHSNSYLFSKAFNYRGVLIEPDPTNYHNLVSNREGEELFNRAICASSQKMHFVSNHERNDAINGIWEFMSPSFRRAWHPEAMVDKMTLIECAPLNTIIENSFLSNRHIDFLSLDVEGAEYEVIKTLDFRKQQFGVIFYEADSSNFKKNHAILTFLESHGYRYVETYHRSNWHINSRWHEIYGHVLR